MLPTEPKDIWSVSGLNREARALLEGGLGIVWVEAEISNLARPASGHIYFTLKDRNAQVRAAFFRQRQRGSVQELTSGDQVLVRARISLYEPRGDYQLIVEHVEPAGQGALQRQFEILKAKLAAEGLFNESSKVALPAIPRQIGIITSPSAAALRDILQVLSRRMPTIPVLVYGSSVQGDAAPEQLRQALHKAVYRNEVDVLIITRGGGAIEDLAAFNDESLARDIAACPIPVISGVGHEIDFTIADFVADVRAPTPSAAAELAVPDASELLRQLRKNRQQLSALVARRIEREQQSLDQISRRLARQNPAEKAARQREQLIRMSTALAAIMTRQQQRVREKLLVLHRRLTVQSPAATLAQRRELQAALSQRLLRAWRDRQFAAGQALAHLARNLNAVSPLATLDRGYAIATRKKDGKALTNVADVAVGDTIDVRLHQGRLSSTVTHLENEPSDA
ncbi:MAG: exodeoxyribonuclease VII large subunit [Woeseiaceae bacterium]